MKFGASNKLGGFTRNNSSS